MGKSGNGKMPKVLAKTSHTKSEMSDDDCEKISNPSLKANLFPSLMRQVEDSKEMPLVKVENTEDTIYATDSDDNEAILVEDSVSPVYSTAFSRGEWTPPEWTSADLPGQVSTFVLFCFNEFFLSNIFCKFSREIEVT